MKDKARKLFVRAIQELLGLFNLPYAIHIEDRETKRLDSYDQPNSSEWFEWLERSSTNKIIVYEMGVYDEEEMCTLQKDSQGIWSAHTIRRGKPYSLSLGKSRELTAEAIVDAVVALYQLPY